MAVLSVLFLFSYWWQWLFGFVWILVFGLGVLILFELGMVYRKNGLEGERILPEKFSNSDLNTVSILLQNKYSFQINISIIDELPIQFQKRDFLRKIPIQGNHKKTQIYEVRPTDRGEYIFGRLNCYVSSQIGLIRRRYT